jgi:hypothetical protein
MKKRRQSFVSSRLVVVGMSISCVAAVPCSRTKQGDCRSATVGTVFANVEGRSGIRPWPPVLPNTHRAKTESRAFVNAKRCKSSRPPTVPLLLPLRLLSDIPVGRYKHIIIRLLTPQCKSQHAMGCAGPQQSCRSLADLALFQSASGIIGLIVVSGSLAAFADPE